MGNGPHNLDSRARCSLPEVTANRENQQRHMRGAARIHRGLEHCLDPLPIVNQSPLLSKVTFVTQWSASNPATVEDRLCKVADVFHKC